MAIPGPSKMIGAKCSNWGPSVTLKSSPEIMAPGYEMVTTTNNKNEKYKIVESAFCHILYGWLGSTLP
ncbi:hypothetical protein BDF19DRAFT_197162 [Syncephalis fuscata]|nr:hypothetical protein BDF19DRAFT_197162 [Syncephalis fuscata]